MSTVIMWEPRYHDKKVLVATRRLTQFPLHLKITRGAMQGDYYIDEEDIKDCPKTMVKWKNGNGETEMTCVPLERLKKVD